MRYLTFAWQRLCREKRDGNFYHTDASPYNTVHVQSAFAVCLNQAAVRRLTKKIVLHFLHLPPILPPPLSYFELPRQRIARVRGRKYLGKCLAVIGKGKKSGRYNSDFHQGTFKVASKRVVCSSSGDDRNETHPLLRNEGLNGKSTGGADDGQQKGRRDVFNGRLIQMSR